MSGSKRNINDREVFSDAADIVAALIEEKIDVYCDGEGFLEYPATVTVPIDDCMQLDPTEPIKLFPEPFEMWASWVRRNEHGEIVFELFE